MEKRYEIQESGVKFPILGRLIARALGDAYVENGGFYNPRAGNPRKIIVGPGRKDENAKGIIALIGDAGVGGSREYVDAVNLERYVQAVEKGRRAA